MIAIASLSAFFARMKFCLWVPFGASSHLASCLLIVIQSQYKRRYKTMFPWLYRYYIWKLCVYINTIGAYTMTKHPRGSASKHTVLAYQINHLQHLQKQHAHLHIYTHTNHTHTTTQTHTHTTTYAYHQTNTDSIYHFNSCFPKSLCVFTAYKWKKYVISIKRYVSV